MCVCGLDIDKRNMMCLCKPNIYPDKGHILCVCQLDPCFG